MHLRVNSRLLETSGIGLSTIPAFDGDDPRASISMFHAKEPLAVAKSRP
jgi:hypothetical protein